jgi:methylphosphotriester-DNA--protein-cysteine methyltransferase/quercetin dioxygenase-like cupin family protein
MEALKFHRSMHSGYVVSDPAPGRIVRSMGVEQRCRTPGSPVDSELGWAIMPSVESKAILQHFPLASRARGQVWHHQPAYRRPRHFHPETELNFVSRGAARLALGREVVELAAGSILWFAPGQSHELVAASADLDLWVIGATPAFAEAVGNASWPSVADRFCHRRLTDSATLELSQRCRATLEGSYDAGAEEAVAAIFACARAGTEAESPARLDSLVARALGQLLIRPDLSRSSLARQLHVSKAELSRRFHAQVGVPFQEYRHRIRVMRFIRHLDDGKHSYLRAAFEAGFGSYSQCFRAFEHVIGYGPRLYFGDGRQVLEDAVAEETGGG